MALLCLVLAEDDWSLWHNSLKKVPNVIEVSYERARRDPGRMEERMRLPSRSKAMAFIVVWSQVVWHGLKKYEVSRSMA